MNTNLQTPDLDAADQSEATSALQLVGNDRHRERQRRGTLQRNQQPASGV